MLTFDFTYTTNVVIFFDEKLEINMTGSMNEIIEKIRWAFNNYPFSTAEAVDARTGEIILTVHNR